MAPAAAALAKAAKEVLGVHGDSRFDARPAFFVVGRTLSTCGQQSQTRDAKPRAHEKANTS